MNIDLSNGLLRSESPNINSNSTFSSNIAIENRSRISLFFFKMSIYNIYL